MLSGYAGRILDVDLGSRQWTVKPLPERLARDYLGGRGFVSRTLFDEIEPGSDPLGPKNVLVMASGPLTGVFLPCSSKVEFGAKSPATGGYGDSNMGGHIGSELKYAGYDMIIIRGQSQSPCYLYIDDDRVEIKDASDLWGKGAIETETALKARLGDEFQMATIGVAGENLVKIACISHDFGRQAGRTGMGAVMGSKKLKAIAVHGTKGVPLADPAKVLEVGKSKFQALFAKPGFKEWTPYGTAGITDWVNEVGSFPTRNFSTGYLEGYEAINGKAVREKILVIDKGCFCCAIPCGKYSHTRVNGREAYVEGPEYETVALIGGNCMLGEVEEVAYANYVMDELGIDTISGGGVVAFAIECFERGIISEADLGRAVRFGDLDSVVHIANLVAKREGIGDVLAEGVRAASVKLGGGSEKFAMHVKGLEISGYEPRNTPAMLLAYMTCDVGAHHNRAWAITYDIAVGREKLEGKAAKVIELQHVRPVLDMVGACRFPWIEVGFELEHYPEIINVVTGSSHTWETLSAIGERVWNLNRCFNVREIPDFGRKYDYPPARIYEEDIPSGPTKGKHITREQIEALLDEYYDLRGWTRGGKPKAEKLAALGLEEEARACGLT